MVSTLTIAKDNKRSSLRRMAQDVYSPSFRRAPIRTRAYKANTKRVLSIRCRVSSASGRSRVACGCDVEMACRALPNSNVLELSSRVVTGTRDCGTSGDQSCDLPRIAFHHINAAKQHSHDITCQNGWTVHRGGLPCLRRSCQRCAPEG
jgi:hypothetical protein